MIDYVSLLSSLSSAYHYIRTDIRLNGFLKRIVHGDLSKHFVKIVVFKIDHFEGTCAGNGKMRDLFCADKTPRLNAAASVHVCVFVLLCANTLIFEKAGLLNNLYYTPVLKSIKQKIYEGTKSYEGTYFYILLFYVIWV